VAIKNTELKQIGKNSIIPLKKEFDTVEEGRAFIEANLADQFTYDYDSHCIGWQYDLGADQVDLEDIEGHASIEFKSQTDEGLKKLFELHYLMYAENKHSVLIIFQGIDASGKDGASKHLFSGFNPQGCRLYSFKKPSEAELEHDYFWRTHRVMPSRGGITIFNRSYYEEITTVKVHTDYLNYQQLPDEILHDKDLFKKRVRQINDFEKILVENGMQIIKFFLHISKDEQRLRLQEKLSKPKRSIRWH
jgi:polyphosphate kinase 2 (PPK2 family)